MNSCERAEKCFDNAESLGMDTPNQSMVADAINDAEANILMHLLGPAGMGAWYDLIEHLQQISDALRIDLGGGE